MLSKQPLQTHRVSFEISFPRVFNYSLLCTLSFARPKDKKGGKNPTKLWAQFFLILAVLPKFRGEKRKKGKKKRGEVCSDHVWIYEQHKYPVFSVICCF